MTESSKNESGNNKKTRVIREDIKDRHTSHWDLDYLSREELEQLMSRKTGNTPASSAPSDRAARAKGRNQGVTRPDRLKPAPPAND